MSCVEEECAPESDSRSDAGISARAWAMHQGIVRQGLSLPGPGAAMEAALLAAAGSARVSASDFERHVQMKWGEALAALPVFARIDVGVVRRRWWESEWASVIATFGPL